MVDDLSELFDQIHEPKDFFVGSIDQVSQRNVLRAPNPKRKVGEIRKYKPG